MNSSDGLEVGQSVERGLEAVNAAISSWRGWFLNQLMPQVHVVGGVPQLRLGRRVAVEVNGATRSHVLGHAERVGVSVIGAVQARVAQGVVEVVLAHYVAFILVHHAQDLAKSLTVLIEI